VLLDLPAEAVLAIEDGKRQPGAGHLVQLAKAYGVRLLWFFGDVSPELPDELRKTEVCIFDNQAVQVRDLTRLFMSIEDDNIRADVLELLQAYAKAQRLRHKAN
jgi:transcriptional regulator with XRE-family HTH domain